MKEGKTISNVKQPILQCESCGYHATIDAFIFGMLWWKKSKCPRCGYPILKKYVKSKNIPPSPKPNITTNMWFDKYLKNLKQNRYDLKKNGLYIGQIEIFTEVLIKELEDTYNYEKDI